uniref:Uncharacterized protein n=1 Tax=Anguilla anguilla TaxID=7936 RepID=A0A0E9PGV4_ANGAN
MLHNRKGCRGNVCVLKRVWCLFPAFSSFSLTKGSLWDISWFFVEMSGATKTPTLPPSRTN